MSGLDPAKPYFDLAWTEARMLPSDAQLVDIIHTNSGLVTNVRNEKGEPIRVKMFIRCDIILFYLFQGGLVV